MNASAPESDPPRAAALDALRTFVDAGFTAYFAGGCVRDRLMGRRPKDYDIATDARPDDVRRLCPRAQAVGEAFGVMLVRRNGFTIEVATFRTDGPYSDHRHPDRVEFSDAEHDARRRDFTINGLFEDPLVDRVIDFVGGRADLDARLIRAIGDPHARLREDELRRLRAIRFAARFEFTIEPETSEAIREGAAALEGVSRERIGHEIRAMLVDRNRAVAAWSLQYHGLDAAVLRETTRTTAPSRLGRLPDDVDYATALAAWMLDRHADDDGRADLDDALQRWTSALMLSNAERAGVRDALMARTALRETWWRSGIARQKRLAAGPGFQAGLVLVRAEDPQAFVDVRRRVDQLARTGLAPTPFVTGEDLIARGLTPGPSFAAILEELYDGQLEGSIRTREEALARVPAPDDS